MSTFIAFDTETARIGSQEICALALVHFENGQVVCSWSSLVNPGVPILPRFTQQCHGISDAHVRQAPRFAEAYAQVSEWFTLGPVVAHNMGFDRRALLGDLARAGLPAPAWRPYCTLAMARRLWPGFSGYKLDAIASHMGVSLNHHEALSDATACGHIAVKAWEKWGEFPDFAKA